MGDEDYRAKWPTPDKALIGVLVKESDRGCVLVGAAFLDEQIKMLLKMRYVSDRDAYLSLLDEICDGKNMSVPYGSAGWALKRASSLGLIPSTQMTRAIKSISELRNGFAHLSHRGNLLLPEVDRIRSTLGPHAAEIREIVCKIQECGTPHSEARIIFMSLVVFLWAHIGQIATHGLMEMSEGRPFRPPQPTP
jgi:hypothetical protein